MRVRQKLRKRVNGENKTKSVFTLSVSVERSVLSGIVWYAKQCKQNILL
nr:MAG TPA: hypothetical protein [Caudoviricetes sp.]